MPLTKRKKNVFLFFFSFARGTVLLPLEARLCFRERHGRAFFGKEKNAFFFFCERHGFASAKGTVVLSREARGVPLSEREKTRVPGFVFASGFFVRFFS